MQPAELFEMMRGQRRVWNRHCLLTAWSTYIIACAFGAFNDKSFERFLEDFPPPGYMPEKPSRLALAARSAAARRA